MKINRYVVLTSSVLLCLLGCATNDKAYEESASLSFIGGAAVGYAGTPSRSYELVNELVQTGSLRELKKMTLDTNKYTRAVGLLCLSAHLPGTKDVMAQCFDDPARIDVDIFGCTGSSLHTVGVFAQRLVESEGFRFCLVRPVNVDSNHVRKVVCEYLGSPSDDLEYDERTSNHLKREYYTRILKRISQNEFTGASKAELEDLRRRIKEKMEATTTKSTLSSEAAPGAAPPER